MKSVSGETLGRIFDRQALVFAWRYLRPYRARIWTYTAGALLQSLLVLPVLGLVRYAFDKAIPAGDVRALVMIGVGIFLIRGFGSVLALMLRSLVLRTVQGAIATLREDLIAVILVRSRAELDKSDPADMQTRVVAETGRADRIFNTLLSGSVPATITFIAVLGLLLVLEWRLVALGILVIPLLFYSSRVMGKVVDREVRIFQHSFERFSRGIHFILRQVDLVRLTGAEPTELERQRAGLLDLRESSRRMAMSYAFHSQMHRTLTGLGGTILLVGGGVGVALGSLTLGEFIAFYVAAGMLNGAANTLLGGLPEIVAGNVALRTLEEFFSDEEREPYIGTAPINFEGGIEFRQVDFGYGDADVLRGVSLVIAPGDHIAITGPNGAGKSTMAHLIAGFYRPRSGQLLADGLPYDSLEIREFRRQIGFVPQHPRFFVGTVRENITYGRDTASPAALEAAVRIAHADEVIALLPQGYDTPVGDGGVMLSGGQLQRLAIARALLGRPRLLILDEPTTHLDAEHVRSVMADLVGLPDGPTVVVISHDPDVVARVRTVYHLETGRLGHGSDALPVLESAR